MSEFGEPGRETRIGLIGTGYISRGLYKLLKGFPHLTVTSVLTRREVNRITQNEYPRPDLLTNSVNQVIENSDLIVECSGDVLHATDVIDCVMQARLPVVTMDAELHVTTGSYFVDKGYITEAEGDQPGSQAAEKEVAELMGFKPLVYGNVKGFLNRNPTKDDMIFWADKQSVTLDQVTSWTDGTKLQVEQTLVANGLGATIAQTGMVGPANIDLREAADILGERAAEIGQPISDYLLSGEAPPGVFIVATHEDNQQESLTMYKMGNGPYYLLVRPYHLAFFEIPKTISRVLEGKPPLLTNSSKPTVGVAAVAKRSVPAGTEIERGIGSFDVRGEAVKIIENPDHVPIGLLSGAVVKNEIEPGQVLTFADIDLPDSLAVKAWFEIRNKAIETLAPV